MHNSDLDASFISANDFASYDRFIVDGKLLTTEAYAERFRKNNSIIVFDNNKYGSISSCLVSHEEDSVADVADTCKSRCIIFVQLFETVRQSHVDDFVNMNTLSLIVQVVGIGDLIPIVPGSISAK